MEQGKHFFIVVGVKTCTTTLRTNLVISQKTRNSSTSRPRYSTLDIYPKITPTSNKDTCSTMFIGALFKIARSWKQPRCPSTEEWVKKMWYINTMEYYSAVKNIIKFADEWVELEKIILSEVS